MSLNGLDDAKVKEAHDTAAAEPGGWFLLKYSARDEVDLLGKGNGGIVEIRNAIAAYEEPTPLFGFLRYRRRNVILKYVPEECSRLVQARVAVHFNAVTERFYPHDTTFSITSSKELKDSKLSAACSLHTASGSTSSSTSSLRRRRLMEITEDEEEDNRAKRQSTVPEDRATTAKPFELSVSALPPTEVPLPEDFASGPPPTSPTNYRAIIADLETSPPPPTSTDYRAIIADLETSPPPPRESTILEAIRPKSPTRSVDERRKSSQSTRPDLYSHSSYGSTGKPKIKLGPRPSLDVGGRPHTSASHFRPVSSLPAGLKLAKTPSKREQHRERPHTQYANASEPPTMTISPPPIPENSPYTSQLRPHTSGGRPTTSSGVSMRPLPSPSSMSSKFPLMTPEKAKLMKALELRRKREAEKGGPTPRKDVAGQPELAILVESSAGPSKEDTLQISTDMANTADSRTSFETPSLLKIDESDATRSDSNPVSPVGASERAESTRASSISESTDETVREMEKDVTPKVNDREPAPVLAGEMVISKGALGMAEEMETEQSQTKVDTTEHLLTTRNAENVVDTMEMEDPTKQTRKGNLVAHIEEGKKAEDLYMLQPHTYTPPITSPVSEREDYNTEPSDFGLPPLRINPHNRADSTSLSTNLPLVVEPSEPEAEKLREPDAQQESFVAVDNVSEVSSVGPPVPVKEWKIPRSKFSRQNLNAELASPSTSSQSLQGHSSDPAQEKSLVGRSTSNDDLSVKRKRRAQVEPIRTDGLVDHSTAESENNLSSDEDFMDELQSAVVQEAMPVTVKSPTSPDFPTPKNKSNRFSRTFSNPLRKDKDESKILGSSTTVQAADKRSVSASAAYLAKINQPEESRPVAKKVNLGSGISQRIKALEKLSNSNPTASPPTAPVVSPGAPSTSFFSIRKGSSSVRESKPTPTVAERANSLSRNTTPPSFSQSSTPEGSKVRERSGSIQNRVEAFKSSPTPLAKTHKPKTESISVTARILRDPAEASSSKGPETRGNILDFKPLDLKESPLLISHQRAGTEPPKETIHERRLSRESASSAPKHHTRERRSSITVIKDFISDISEGRNSFSDRRRSMNIEVFAKSPTKSPSRPPSTHTTRPMSISSRLSIGSRDMSAPSPALTTGSSSSNNDEKPEKKQSRASRLMNRMSSSLTSSRKNAAHTMSPTVREESEPPNFNDSRSLISPNPSRGSMAPTPTLNSLGEVNVQFPDSLLWKWRSMAIDSQGYIILTASGTAKDTKGGPGANRRFHLSEFRLPAIPDADMQELPNSVVLDFVEGGGLQVACEDRAGQSSLLKVLQESHRVWAAYGQ